MMFYSLLRVVLVLRKGHQVPSRIFMDSTTSEESMQHSPPEALELDLTLTPPKNYDYNKRDCQAAETRLVHCHLPRFIRLLVRLHPGTLFHSCHNSCPFTILLTSSSLQLDQVELSVSSSSRAVHLEGEIKKALPETLFHSFTIREFYLFSHSLVCSQD